MNQEGGREPAERSEDQTPPPFLGTWPRVYALVLVWLAVLIALFALFTRVFA